MNTPKWSLATSLALLAFVLPARAGIDGQSLGTSAPPSSLGGITVIAFSADPSALNSAVTSVALPALAVPSGSLLFDVSVEHLRVGPAGWQTWSNGYTGDVYAVDVFLGAGPGGSDQLQITLPTDTHAFYFYLEPGTFDVRDFSVHATTNNPGETFDFPSTSIVGDSGAVGFGLFTTGPLPSTLNTVTITGFDTWPEGFAVGEFGIEGTIGTVPDESLTVFLLAIPLLALAAYHRRFRTR